MSFHKVSGGDTLNPHSGRGHPLLHPFTARPVARRGACVPVLGPKPWSPSTFQPWLRPCYMQQVFPWAHPSHERKRYLDRFQIFCRANLGDRPTDRPTDHATCSITIIGIYLVPPHVVKERKGNKAYLYSAIRIVCYLKALRHGSHSFICKYLFAF